MLFKQLHRLLYMLIFLPVMLWGKEPAYKVIKAELDPGNGQEGCHISYELHYRLTDGPHGHRSLIAGINSQVVQSIYINGRNYTQEDVPDLLPAVERNPLTAKVIILLDGKPIKTYVTEINALPNNPALQLDDIEAVKDLGRGWQSRIAVRIEPLLCDCVAFTRLHKELTAKKLHDLAEGWKNKGNYLYTSWDYREARKCYLRSLLFTPADNYLTERIRLCEEMGGKYERQMLMDKLLKLGRAAMDAGDVEVAIEKYRQAGKLDPSNTAVKAAMEQAGELMSAKADDKHNPLVQKEITAAEVRNYIDQLNRLREAAGKLAKEGAELDQYYSLQADVAASRAPQLERNGQLHQAVAATERAAWMYLESDAWATIVEKMVQARYYRQDIYAKAAEERCAQLAGEEGLAACQLLLALGEQSLRHGRYKAALVYYAHISQRAIGDGAVILPLITTFNTRIGQLKKADDAAIAQARLWARNIEYVTKAKEEAQATKTLFAQIGYLHNFIFSGENIAIAYAEARAYYSNIFAGLEKAVQQDALNQRIERSKPDKQAQTLLYTPEGVDRLRAALYQDKVIQLYSQLGRSFDKDVVETWQALIFMAMEADATACLKQLRIDRDLVATARVLWCGDVVYSPLQMAALLHAEGCVQQLAASLGPQEYKAVHKQWAQLAGNGEIAGATLLKDEAYRTAADPGNGSLESFDQLCFDLGDALAIRLGDTTLLHFIRHNNNKDGGKYIGAMFRHTPAMWQRKESLYPYVFTKLDTVILQNSRTVGHSFIQLKDPAGNNMLAAWYAGLIPASVIHEAKMPVALHAGWQISAAELSVIWKEASYRPRALIENNDAGYNAMHYILLASGTLQRPALRDELLRYLQEKRDSMRAGNISYVDKALLKRAVLMHDPEYRTLLHYAAANGDMALAECLLALGARPLARDNEGHTAADLAALKGHKELARNLKKLE